MADSLVTTGAPTATFEGRPAIWPTGEVLRDIARGGMAGTIRGILVAGLGGRLVARSRAGKARAKRLREEAAKAGVIPLRVLGGDRDVS